MTNIRTILGAARDTSVQAKRVYELVVISFGEETNRNGITNLKKIASGALVKALGSVLRKETIIPTEVINQISSMGNERGAWALGTWLRPHRGAPKEAELNREIDVLHTKLLGLAALLGRYNREAVKQASATAQAKESLRRELSVISRALEIIRKNNGHLQGFGTLWDIPGPRRTLDFVTGQAKNAVNEMESLITQNKDYENWDNTIRRYASVIVPKINLLVEGRSYYEDRPMHHENADYDKRNREFAVTYSALNRMVLALKRATKIANALWKAQRDEQW